MEHIVVLKTAGELMPSTMSHATFFFYPSLSQTPEQPRVQLATILFQELHNL
jgi:hypothetical protein